jgi:hypothetical protein
VDEVKQNMAVILLVMEVEHREDDDEWRHARAKSRSTTWPARLGEDGEGLDGKLAEARTCPDAETCARSEGLAVVDDELEAEAELGRGTDVPDARVAEHVGRILVEPTPTPTVAEIGGAREVDE